MTSEAEILTTAFADEDDLSLSALSEMTYPEYNMYDYAFVWEHHIYRGYA